MLYPHQGEKLKAQLDLANFLTEQTNHMSIRHIAVCKTYS